MEVFPACGMQFSPLTYRKHRQSPCDGTTIQPHMRSTRPGRVNSRSIRAAGAELRRIEANEARLILDGDLPADRKPARIREDILVNMKERS